jgi:ketosteroid isomerase-like protein
MKTKLIWWLGTLLLAGLASQTGALPPSNAEDEVRAFEQRWNGAHAKNDLKTYFSYYAPHVMQFLPDGRPDLTKYEKDWTTYMQGGNKIQAVEIRDPVVFAYVLDVKTKLADGKITEEENQETDVWFKRGGEWKVVALHYSPVPPKK